MPEFHLDTAGEVKIGHPAAGTENVTCWRDLDSFTQGYIEALFFTSTGEDGEAFEQGFSDLASETLARVLADCAAFQGSSDWQAFLTLRDNGGAEGDDDQGGRDFWFTRNGHGVGFWDREPDTYASHAEALTDAAKAFGYADAYVGDDGKVYLQHLTPLANLLDHTDQSQRTPTMTDIKHAIANAQSWLETIDTAQTALDALYRNDTPQTVDGETFTDADVLRERMEQMPLAVSVRSGWSTPYDTLTPSEYQILLSTGGPALRIVGDLNEHGEPETARLEYQDWGTPWVSYTLANAETARALAFASLFLSA